MLAPGAAHDVRWRPLASEVVVGECLAATDVLVVHYPCKVYIVNDGSWLLTARSWLLAALPIKSSSSSSSRRSTLGEGGPSVV